MINIRAIDFEYDSKLLSDYGFIICDFNYSSGLNEVTVGADITFNKVPRNSGKKFSLTSTQFDECITTTFDICKNPDENKLEDMEITNDEYKDIVRWLNRREFLRFSLLGETDYEYDIFYYNASFNVSKLNIGEKLYGIRLNMETESPYGYGQEQIYTHTFNNVSLSWTISDTSDTIGEISPTVKIKCLQDGDLYIYNKTYDFTTIIKNCIEGEEITILGDAQMIESSIIDHDISNDFNFTFFKICNSLNCRDNKVMVSLPCTLTIKYSPVISITP